MKDELLVNSNPKSSVAEAIRMVRTNLMFSLKVKKGKVVLITSSVKGEGKSFVSANLAISFAQKGLKVLLVDSDLRLGRLHSIFKISNKVGFSHLLADDDGKNYKRYIKETKIENLYFIPRGMVPPNPSELLDSVHVLNFLENVRKKFDVILFDGTPINGLTDSLVFTKYVDKVVVVSAANYTKVNLLENTIKCLKKLDVDLAGVVVNKIKNPITSSYCGEYYTND